MALSVEWTVGGEGELMLADVFVLMQMLLCALGAWWRSSQGLFFPFIRSRNMHVIVQQGPWFYSIFMCEVAP